MRKRITLGIIILLIIITGTSLAGKPKAADLLQEAKILIFDKKWAEAEAKLTTLIQQFPHSPLVTEALFYRARCLQEQPGRETEAIAAYQQFLRRKEKNPSLEEEAEVSIIDLAYELYKKGRKDYVSLITGRLDRSNKVIQYYAALKLSYIPEKKIARRCLKVLKKILSEEKDEELRDRAKIALLRVDPKALDEYAGEKTATRTRLLHLQVFEEGQLKVNLTIPWVLADLALRAVDERSKELLKEKGYDIDRIIKELNEFKGEILEIKSEETVIRLWVD